ncbi:ABC transporter permease [Spelaeicoccus albus]|uniref:Peptide/nickel transport system permease protein n=1 Tax=Spelaeicoccus albus TaxID=1280376 RepID=A0A7Z0D1N6_9MICO|nr:ABC transporter permease [Spelaeicoccus albus]NYI67403.1 peptide/nickel transport system permease protein [Spelaeicoccus albus]
MARRRPARTVRAALLRFGGLVLTALLASLFVFLLLDSTPGNAAVLGSGGEGSSLRPDAIAARERQFGLTHSVWVRFALWLAGVAHGDLGVSIQYRMPVSQLLLERAGVTAQLAVLATVFAVAVGLAAGFAAVRFRRADKAVVAGTALVSAVPSYAVGTLLVAVLAVQLGWFPSYGGGAGLGDGVWSRLHHLFLPAFTLGLGGSAVIARITRASLASELARPHARLAEARGVDRGRIVVRHLLPGGWPPIAMITGLEIAGFLGGAAIVESLFAIPGLGMLLVDSVQTKDFAVVQALILISLIGYALVTTAVDLAGLAARRRAGLQSAAGAGAAEGSGPVWTR